MQTQIVIRLSILTEIKFKLDTVQFVNDGTQRENKKKNIEGVTLLNHTSCTGF